MKLTCCLNARSIVYPGNPVSLLKSMTVLSLAWKMSVPDTMSESKRLALDKWKAAGHAFMRPSRGSCSVFHAAVLKPKVETRQSSEQTRFESFSSKSTSTASSPLNLKVIRQLPVTVTA